MQTEWLPIRETAERLGVSTRTVRRWIREGRISSELRPGPYGEQYFIPVDQIQTAHEVRDLVRADRPIDLITLAHTLDGYLRQKESAVAASLEALRGEVQQALRLQEERETALYEELARARQEILITRQEFQATLSTMYQRLEYRTGQIEEAVRTQGTPGDEQAKRRWR
jgi:excisionase family DNA binding protein